MQNIGKIMVNICSYDMQFISFEENVSDASNCEQNNYYIIAIGTLEQFNSFTESQNVSIDQKINVRQLNHTLVYTCCYRPTSWTPQVYDTYFINQ